MENGVDAIYGKQKRKKKKITPNTKNRTAMKSSDVICEYFSKIIEAKLSNVVSSLVFAVTLLTVV